MYIGTDSWPWTIFHASLLMRRHSVLRKPNIRLRTVDAVSRQMDQAVAERNAMASRDMHVLDLKADPTLPCREPVL